MGTRKFLRDFYSRVEMTPSSLSAAEEQMAACCDGTDDT